MSPSIRKIGDKLQLTFPPRTGNVNAHSVTLPTTRAGLDCLVRILDAAEQLGGAEPYIATEASPIQSMVDAWLAKGNKITKASHATTLADLGLD